MKLRSAWRMSFESTFSGKTIETYVTNEERIAMANVGHDVSKMQ